MDVSSNLGTMGDALSGIIGNRSGWPGGVAQATVPVTNLTPHVDGGGASAQTANRAADPDSRQTLYWSAAIVFLAVALLWSGGTLVFKGSNF